METMAKKGDTLWMTSYDGDGYCGREYHPKRSDIGLLGEVIRIFHAQEEDFFETPGDCDYVCYTVLTHESEPRLLELMEHEVTRVVGPCTA